MTKSVILTHPTGNPNVRGALNGLNNAGLLNSFITSIATFPGDMPYQLGGHSPFTDIRKRTYDKNLSALTYSWPWKETGRILSSKAGLHSFLKHESGIFCIDAVYKSIDKHVSEKLKQLHKRGIKAIYAYEDGARASFKQAHQLNIKCLYDLPIGYWRAARRLLTAEQDKYPEWASTMTGLLDSDQKLSYKDEELKLADRIYVASKFTASTLQEFPGKLAPIEIIPYGFPPISATNLYSKYNGVGPLKLLFVGGLSQRKGIANLFEAVEKFGKHLELTLVGKKPVDDCEVLNRALKRYKWIPSLPLKDVLLLMKNHDALVFPSLFEGFGLVITEAMSQGTPVITTERTAGPDLISHGENGWLIKAGDTVNLIDCIDFVLANPRNLISVSREALNAAGKRPWEVYGKELAESIAGNITY